MATRRKTTKKKTSKRSTPQRETLQGYDGALYPKGVPVDENGLALEDEEIDLSVARNLPMDAESARLMKENALIMSEKSRGEKRIRWSSDDSIKYQQVVTMHPNAHVGIRQIEPDIDDNFDSKPVSHLRDYSALIKYIREHHWTGQRAVYKWRVSEKGMIRQWATGEITFAERQMPEAEDEDDEDDEDMKKNNGQQPPWMQQQPPWMHQQPPWMQQQPPWMQQAPWGHGPPPAQQQAPWMPQQQQAQPPWMQQQPSFPPVWPHAAPPPQVLQANPAPAPATSPTAASAPVPPPPPPETAQLSPAQLMPMMLGAAQAGMPPEMLGQFLAQFERLSQANATLAEQVRQAAVAQQQASMQQQHQPQQSQPDPSQQWWWQYMMNMMQQPQGAPPAKQEPPPPPPPPPNPIQQAKEAMLMMREFSRLGKSLSQDFTEPAPPTPPTPSLDTPDDAFPFAVKDVGHFRAVANKDGTPVSFFTQAMFNLDKVGDALGVAMERWQKSRPQEQTSAVSDEEKALEINAKKVALLREAREHHEYLTRSRATQQQQSAPPVVSPPPTQAAPPPPPVPPTQVAPPPPPAPPAQQNWQLGSSPLMQAAQKAQAAPPAPPVQPEQAVAPTEPAPEPAPASTPVAEPEPVVVAAPSELSSAPEPASSPAEPAPASLTPEPATSPTPEPATSPTPEPATSPTPEPATSPTPEPATTPSQPVQAASAPEVQVVPKVNNSAPKKTRLMLTGVSYGDDDDQPADGNADTPSTP